MLHTYIICIKMPSFVPMAVLVKPVKLNSNISKFQFQMKSSLHQRERERESWINGDKL